MPGLREIFGQLPHRGKHQAEMRGKCWLSAFSIFQVPRSGSVQVWHVAKSHAATTLPVPEGWQPPHFRDEVTASEWIPLHKNDKNDDMNIMNVDFNDF